MNKKEIKAIDELTKINIELKQKLGEADEAVEYWQKECDKRSKVLDKLKEYIENDILDICEEVGIGKMVYDKLNELLEEIE